MDKRIRRTFISFLDKPIVYRSLRIVVKQFWKKTSDSLIIPLTCLVKASPIWLKLGLSAILLLSRSESAVL